MTDTTFLSIFFCLVSVQAQLESVVGQLNLTRLAQPYLDNLTSAIPPLLADQLNSTRCHLAILF